MSFLDTLEQTTNKQAHTENGAISNISTLNPVLDLFSKAGAMRGDTSAAVELFKKAYVSDKLLTLRCLFYLRDVRGGQGEREIFRKLYKELWTLDRDTAEAALHYIPEYGRWDDVVNVGWPQSANMIEKQLYVDEQNMAEGKPVSLLAKWLPSTNASSKKSRKLALQIAKQFNLKESQYRKKVSTLRKYIKLLEQSMSSKQWDSIDYEKIPSQAHRKHTKAFKRNDEARYEKYLEAVNKGEAKINTSTLFTYEVYNMVNNGEEAAANAMWANLPDYTNGQNALVLPDVSGSMYGLPISIAVSLALYFAERNEGPFKDCFLEFSSTSKLVRVRGETLSENMMSVQNSTNWMGSTNLQSAFNAILVAAQQSNATQDEMPKTLYIISDMQFNQATTQNDTTNLELARRAFEAAGYELPHVVFWNCNAYGNDSPATIYDKNVTLISGSNQSTFQYVVAGKTPLESMLDVLNSERYAKIKV